MLAKTDAVFTVSEITKAIKEVIEGTFTEIRLEGEISNFRPASSGHWYFTLKDEDAAISAVMFKGSQRQMNFTPEDGSLVVVRGRLSVYEKRGSYQIICQSMQRAGQGDILLMLQQRKQKLAAEGYFDTEHKKPLPFLPCRIVLITSPTGAAVQDFLRVSFNRNPAIDISILPALCQGDGASAQLRRRIRQANEYRMGDLIVLTRGGGSLEDLLPFSEEELVKEIYHSEIPIISAVGHEIDVSLSDLAADRRAATPSAAAEMALIPKDELLNRISHLQQSCIDSIQQKSERARLLLKHFDIQRIDQNLRMLLQPAQMRLDDALESLNYIMRDFLSQYKHRLAISASQIQDNSPLGILEKGYAVVLNQQNGKILRSWNEAEVKDKIKIRLAKGSLEAKVEEKHGPEEL